MATVYLPTQVDYIVILSGTPEILMFSSWSSLIWGWSSFSASEGGLFNTRCTGVVSNWQASVPTNTLQKLDMVEDCTGKHGERPLQRNPLLCSLCWLRKPILNSCDHYPQWRDHPPTLLCSHRSLPCVVPSWGQCCFPGVIGRDVFGPH